MAEALAGRVWLTRDELMALSGCVEHTAKTSQFTDWTLWRAAASGERKLRVALEGFDAAEAIDRRDHNERGRDGDG